MREGHAGQQSWSCRDAEREGRAMGGRCAPCGTTAAHTGDRTGETESESQPPSTELAPIGHFAS